MTHNKKTPVSPFTGAKWITTSVASRNESTNEPLFRIDFQTHNKKIVKAELYATARGYYEFSINSQKVGDQFLAPGWSDYFHTIMYQVYDITEMLAENLVYAIGIMIAKGWFSGPHQMVDGNYDLYGKTQSVIGKLLITYEDGSQQEIVTDDSWLCNDGPIMYADNYRGEGYDARLARTGWDHADYTDLNDWLPALVVAPPAANEQLDLPAAELVLQTDPPIREIERFTPVDITPATHPTRRTYDVGQNIAGFITIKIRGKQGDKIEIKYAEMLNTPSAYEENGVSVGGGDGPIGTLYRASLRHHFAAGHPVAVDTYILSGSSAGEAWTPRFTFHGFRYFEITGADVEILTVEAIAISTDNKMLSSFECSNPKVNQLYSNVKWSMLGNHVGIPTDCPNRDERLAYTGDAQIFALTATYLQDVFEFYTRWLKDIRDYQATQTGIHKGLVPVLAPNDPRTHNFSTQWSAGWGDAVVIMPWHLFQMYGNVQIIHDSYESMKNWCDFLYHEDRTRDHLRRLGGASRDNNYGDWVAIPHDLPDDYKRLTGSLFMAYSHQLFAKMLTAIGDPQGEVSIYEGRAKKITEAILAEYFDRPGFEGKLTHSGLQHDGQFADDYTEEERREKQTAYAMILYFNLDPSHNAIYAKRLATLVEENDGCLSSGFIGVSYLAPALADNGYPEMAYTLLEQEAFPSWIYSINQGATTTWERWNSYTIENGFGPIEMNSFNHYAFGSIGGWLISGVLGITRDERNFNNVGFHKFILNPQYGGSLTYAKGHYDSTSGKIESSWERKADGTFEYCCTVPIGTEATAYIPALSEAEVTCENKDAISIKFDSEKQRAVFTLTAGTYQFVSRV